MLMRAPARLYNRLEALARIAAERAAMNASRQEAAENARLLSEPMQLTVEQMDALRRSVGLTGSEQKLQERILAVDLVVKI
jgi:hypothetical protein